MDVACPHCRSPVLYDPHLAGQTVACAACNGRFVMPSAPPPIPGRPSPGSSPGHSFEPPVIQRTDRRLKRVESFSLWYIFDWKFEKYLTPWIIRGYWVLSLAVGALLMVTIVVHTLAWFVPEPSKPAPKRADGVTFEQHFENPFGSKGFRDASKSIQGGIEQLLLGCSALVAVMFLLLSIRLVCESVIVLFNIAASATAIEKALAGGDRESSA